MRSALFCGFGWVAREMWLPGLKAAGFEKFGVFDEYAQVPDNWRTHTRDELANLGPADYDVAVIATPNATHAQIAVPLLSRGMRIVVEKPVCGSTAELRALREAAEHGGGTLLRSRSIGYDTHFAQFAALVHAEGLTAPAKVSASWIRRSGIPNSPWLTRAEHALAGSCIDLGWHLLEGVMELTDFAPLEPVAATYTPSSWQSDPRAGRAGWHGGGQTARGLVDPVDVDIAASVTCRSATGTDVDIDTAWTSGSAADSVTFNVAGSAGSYRMRTIFGMSTDVQQTLNIEVAGTEDIHTIDLPEKIRGSAHAAMVSDYASCGFDPLRLGQSWEQLDALVRTAEVFINGSAEQCVLRNT